jgi:hypothetical protein
MDVAIGVGKVNHIVDYFKIIVTVKEFYSSIRPKPIATCSLV